MEFAVRPIGVEGQDTARPEEGLTREVRVTVPTKLCTLVRETEAAWLLDPELKLMGLATEILKSPT